VLTMLAYLFVTFFLAISVNLFPITNPWLSGLVHALILVVYVGVVYFIERPKLKSIAQ
jgi:hypothetical protein